MSVVSVRIDSVGIIGAGAVGHTVGTLLTAAGWTDTILVTSRTRRSADALVADLEDLAVLLNSPTRLAHVPVAEMLSCDAVVVCPRAAFSNTAVRDVRMAGLRVNAPLIARLGRVFAGYHGPVIVVTNPVDPMTWLFARASGVSRVYGVGSATDTARLRLTLAGMHGVSVSAVSGRVVGEHGDAAVPCMTTVGGAPVEVDPAVARAALSERPRRINEGLGRARSGPAGAVLSALHHALGLVDGTVELSTPHDGSCTGVPVRFIGGQGVVLDPGLGPEHRRRHAAAADKVRAAFHTVRHHITREETPVHTRISTAGHHVTVTSQTAAVPRWAARYVRPWWDATETATPPRDGDGPVVDAHVDPGAVSRLVQSVTDHPNDSADFAGAVMVYRHDDTEGTVSAAHPGLDLAYHYRPKDRCMHIVGCTETAVATAAARVARELMRAQLHEAGWHVLHASAAVRGDGETVLVLGGKGAGKTTTALALARSGNWRLLANDRVFARLEDNTRVRVLPWPSAAAIGLGLLDALGEYDGVRARVLAGEQMHPTQNAAVTAALAEGSRQPLRSPAGKELKVQFFPDQLPWLGLGLATTGYAARVLFPGIDPAAKPALTDAAGRTVSAGDFFTPASDDRYTDVFGLIDTTPAAAVQREALAAALGALPRQGLVLTHDVQANSGLLDEL
ncbi:MULTISPECIES: lactate/malate family dehydrogenase [Streptomyces]|uniref:lactate/malate family dehydrogenase n=1 Tax=Streptomyces TaxID=1883 RepID=UPI00025CDFA4|nr:NAD(P)-binding domain-containing protein [Streptomyces tsukubensis]EIF93215.1 hypothetical protein [Streptomyces tsukubensis NRRL18488]